MNRLWLRFLCWKYGVCFIHGTAKDWINGWFDCQECLYDALAKDGERKSRRHGKRGIESGSFET